MDEQRKSVIRLEEAAALPVEAVGGKAATLARLAAAGFPVPAGLVVTSAAWARPADELAAEITAGLQPSEFGRGGQFAVRSSAAAEDLAEASFAGLYETFLDIPADQVMAAVTRCREAAATARVAAYQSRRAGHTKPMGETPAVAVLVQPMVSAVAAGVAFTANPLTGDRSETLVSAVRGVGERLVAGEAVGDEWSIRHGVATPRRIVEDAITAGQAVAVASLAAGVERQLGRAAGHRVGPGGAGGWRSAGAVAGPADDGPAGTGRVGASRARGCGCGISGSGSGCPSR